MVALLCASPLALSSHKRRSTSSRAPRRAAVLVRANQPLREFNENDGKLTAGSDKVPEGDEEAGKEKAGPLYADENPPPPRDTMSPEMKKRLKQEYLGLGGSPNTAMGGNYFLYIILAISVLAVLSKLTGAI
ncbi:hypothetical protein D9Q98_001262 [Chlorella vulgaris]|uniref:Uncharacterized protein n=1 Tax=Chlorella vulgaris TaxID=3077 RepID=A0A9D4TZU2_CHLVU|nr:hypothetical protein D9Q98_001262 [Chlorella vulgaris]